MKSTMVTTVMSASLKQKIMISSSNVRAVNGEADTNRKLVLAKMTRRRGGLLSSLFLVAMPMSIAAATPQADDSTKTALLQKYRKKSEENKAKNDKERLEDYYKRNYKDYFEFVEGSIRGKEGLSESEKGILEWLQKHK